MTTDLKRIQTKARQLARSGAFFGSRPIEFVLQFEEGYAEAQAWLHSPATHDELDRLCRKARTARRNAEGMAA